MMHVKHALRLWPLLLATACAAPSEATSDSEPEAEQVTFSVEGWTPEIIALPPQFAPELPTGVESLLFAPGFRNSDAEDFWSYVFVLWIDEPAPDAARLDEMLELYYDGLISAVAGAKGEDVGSDPAQVDVTRVASGHFEVRMRLIDAFFTFEPIDLRARVDTVAETSERTILRIQASPQPETHAIWRSLEAAVASIQEP
jgi:hypothetical protein